MKSTEPAFNVISQPMDVWAKEMEWDGHAEDWSLLTLDPGRIELPASGSFLITEVLSEMAGALRWRAFLGIERFRITGHQFLPVRTKVISQTPHCFAIPAATTEEINHLLRDSWTSFTFMLVASEVPLLDSELMDFIVRLEKEELGRHAMPGHFVAATGHDNNYWMFLHKNSNKAAIQVIENICKSSRIPYKTQVPD